MNDYETVKKCFDPVFSSIYVTNNMFIKTCSLFLSLHTFKVKSFIVIDSS